MIRRNPDSLFRLSDHFTLHQSIGKRARHKNIVEPHVRIPRRKGVSLIPVQLAITAAVSSIEHSLNSFALQLATADPDQGANPCRHAIKFQNLSRRERVEVSCQDVKAVLMSLDSFEQ